MTAAILLNLGGAGASAPTLSSAVILGAQLALVFTEVMEDGGSGVDDFTLSLSGGAATATYSSGLGSNALLYALSRSVADTETGTLSYTQPGAGLQSDSANELQSFTGEAISFWKEPEGVSASVASDGITLSVVYDEAISTGASGHTGVSVSASGGAVTPTYSSGLGSSTLVYTLDRTIDATETLTTSYTQPGAGYKDSDDLNVDTYSGLAVTNGSIQDTIAPTYVSSMITAGGDEMEVTLSENITVTDGTGFSLANFSGGAVTPTYSSVTDNVLTFTLSRTVASSETGGEVSYATVADGIEDSAGNDLGSFSDRAVTNPSLQEQGAGLRLSIAIGL
jgi:hypothetical protein